MTAVLTPPEQEAHRRPAPTRPDRPRPRPRPATTPRPRPPVAATPAPVLPARVAPAPVAPAPRGPRPTRSPGWLVLVLLVEAVVAFDLHTPWLRPLAGLVAVAGLPVLVLTRRTFADVEERLVAFLYACGATVLGIIGVALALNTGLPFVGVDRPLDRPALVGASTIVDLVLVGRSSTRRLLPTGAVRIAVRRVALARFDPAVVLAVAAVVTAVAGAVRLNNGLGGGVAVLAHVVEIAALGTALLRRGPRGRNALTVYLVGAALLLGTSLRGWYITGHDIQNEYLAFLYTHDAGHWSMSVYPQPYNACLSVNILPTVLVNFLGVGGVFVFKVVAQLVFALVPVCVYASARRMLPRRTALLAAALFMFFPTFFTDMPFLVRQEYAYLFVAVVSLAAFQPGWSARTRRLACVAFGIGVVLSHYSTTYVLIITLVLGMLGAVAGARYQVYGARLATWRGRRRRSWRSAPTRRGGTLALLGPVVVLGLIASAWLWSSPATHSDGHLTDTVGQLSKSILEGRASAGSSDTKYSLLGGGGPTAQQRLDEYAAAAVQARAGSPASSYVFPDTTGALAHPTVSERPYLPLTAVGRALRFVGVDVHSVNSVLRSGTAGVFQLLLGIGVLALLLRARNTRRIGREQFWLMLASISALGAVVVVPGLSADYGVLRAFQQTLLFAAPLLAIGLTTVFTRLRHAAFRGAVIVTLGVGLVLTGAQPAALGGYYAQLSQSNSGQYYDLLYVQTPELSAARWLAGATASQDSPATVTASDIVSVTRLQSFLPRSDGVSGEYLPTQLRTGAYVFMGPQTSTRGEATIFYTGDLLTYSYPTAAVDGSLDLLYSTAGTRIYR